MKRFRFPLARVLRWREHQERAARRGLAQALGALDELERQRAALQRGQAALGGEESGNARALAAALRHGLAARDARLAAGEAERQELVDAARQDLLRRRRDAQLLRGLRDAQRDQWRQQQIADEQVELEDLHRAGGVR